MSTSELSYILIQFHTAWDVIVFNFNRFWPTIPSGLRFLVILALVAAGINIVLPLIKAIIKHKASWKQKPGTKLMYSFAAGSGFHQFKQIYVETHRLLFDRKWSVISFAGLAYRLGNHTNSSKVILFLCSLAYIPLAIMGIAEMLIRFILGLIIYHILAVAYLFLLLALWILNLILIPLFNLADKTTQVTQHCPHDYATFKLPIFECPHCSELHDNLVPGTTGLLWTKCTCGHFIPCASLTKRKKLNSYCPKCRHALASSNVRALTLQVVGGNSSGKTAFISAFQHQYIDSVWKSGNHSVSTSPEDEFQALEDMYNTGRTEASSHDKVHAYYILHNSSSSSDNGIIIYDVPDEIILSEQYERNPLNFGYCDGIVLVIDPLSIPSVRKECEAAAGGSSTDGWSNDSTEDIIVHFIIKYSEVAGRTARKMTNTPVAVLITKSDLVTIRRKIGYVKIKAEYAANPHLYNSFDMARDQICRHYLNSIGLSNALNNLDSVFSQISFFPVSAIGHVADGRPFDPQRVLIPIAWIARQCQSSICNISAFKEEGIK